MPAVNDAHRAARAIGVDRLLTIVKADEGADHEVAAVADIEVLTDIECQVQRSLAVDLAVGVGELHLTGKEVLVVEAAAVELAAAEETLEGRVRLIAHGHEELERVPRYAVASERGGGASVKRRVQP